MVSYGRTENAFSRNRNVYFVNHHLRDYARTNPDLVSTKMSIRHPDLQVVKYKNKVFYKNLWTPELMEMRGLVVDRDWDVIVRPFTKVFNRHENGMDFHRDTPIVAVRKINGFMAALTNDYLHGVIVSTTGSLDSQFVTLAEKYLLPYGEYIPHEATYIFEIVDPEDPHIVDEKPGAYLIGVRCISSGETLAECDLDILSYDLPGVMRPEWKICRFGDIVNEVKLAKHEGFMVHDRKGGVLKIKSPYYLVKKFFSRVNAEKLTSDWITKNRETFDEEYLPLVDHIRVNCDSFTLMKQNERKTFIENFLNNL